MRLFTLNRNGILVKLIDESMKMLIIDTYYQDALTKFYASMKTSGLNYEEQWKQLMNQNLFLADYYSRNISDLGWEAKEFVINDKCLQKKWAQDNGINFGENIFSKIPYIMRLVPSKWQEVVLKAQIKAYRPEIIYCQDLNKPGIAFLNGIRREVQGIKLVVGQIASKIDFSSQNLGYDLILTSFPHYVEKFRKIGVKSEYFRIGFEKSILSKVRKTDTNYEAVFIGGFSDQHGERLRFLEYLALNVDVDFWGYGLLKYPNSPIIRKYHGKIWGLPMYDVLYNSKISINKHIDEAENFANNMRLYESTGVGTMLLTDFKDNLHELFEIGKEIETYKTKEELKDKVKYYLNHDKEREKIAMAGQRRTLEDHTYEKRMKELSAILTKYI